MGPRRTSGRAAALLTVAWVVLLLGPGRTAAAPLSAAQLQRARLALRNLIPKPGQGDGWRAAGSPQLFGADALKQRLPKQADALAALNPRQGVAVGFTAAAGTTSLVLLDMGGVLRSLAGLQRVQPAGARPAAIGQRAFQAGGSWWFCQGNYLGTASGPAAEAIARRVAQGARGAGEPTILDLLPAGGRVQGSEKALPDGIPGLAFLGGAAGAAYAVGGQKVTLHLVSFDTREVAAEVFVQLAQEAQTKGRNAVAVTTMGDEVLSAEFDGLGRVAAARLGKFIAVASGAGDVGVLQVPLATAVQELTQKLGANGLK